MKSLHGTEYSLIKSNKPRHCSDASVVAFVAVEQYRGEEWESGPQAGMSARPASKEVNSRASLVS